ncbi:MAG: tannase/feruloyl esterase family alpha/beta hydrolase [Roseiarcus sp.]
MASKIALFGAALPTLEAGGLILALWASATGAEAASATLAPEACAALAAPIPATAIGLPSGAAEIESATYSSGSPLAVAERAPTPASRVSPALPAYCRVLGHIQPLDPKAPPIQFEVNLPAQWNGRSAQYGGGGFNGVLITGLGLAPAGRFDQPAPLARGYVTVGTDSGHQAAPGQPPQVFALNDEAFLNFSHAAYKKVRDVAVALMKRAYGAGPEKLYYLGSSEGGREALTMAQRYPDDFDGIFARVPVIGWTGLQHAGTRDGLATMGEAWLRPAQVELVADAVVAACGAVDGIVGDAAGCRAKFDPARLLCAAGRSGDGCLSAAQVAAVDALHSPYRFPFPLANGVTEYPGWGVSGEATPAFGPTGGWRAWWLGASAPTLPPAPDNGIAWVFGSGGMRYVFARDPDLDVARYRPEDHADRVREVSALMDSTNPDLSAFAAHGGKLIMLEHMSDYAQSPYAGIGYFQSVEARLGKDQVRAFARLYTAPGVDHVGSGAPANVDMLSALADWVERGRPPQDLSLVEQGLAPSFPVLRARPLCEWPQWPHYAGGDVKLAASFACAD